MGGTTFWNAAEAMIGTDRTFLIAMQLTNVFAVMVSVPSYDRNDPSHRHIESGSGTHQACSLHENNEAGALIWPRHQCLSLFALVL
jgi:hypothetical protein